MTSPITPTTNTKSRLKPIANRGLSPISRAHPCYIDLHAHGYHCYEGNKFLAAFSSKECAEHTMEIGILRDLDPANKPHTIVALIILHFKTGTEYRRLGTEWIAHRIRPAIVMTHPQIIQ